MALDDELVSRYSPSSARATVSRWLATGAPGAYAAATALIRASQRRAQNLAFRRRRTVLRTDTWLDESLSFVPAEVDQ